MRAIDSDERTYRASEGGTLVNTDQGTKLLSNFMVPQVLTLKIGAQVMCHALIDLTGRGIASRQINVLNHLFYVQGSGAVAGVDSFRSKG